MHTHKLSVHMSHIHHTCLAIKTFKCLLGGLTIKIRHWQESKNIKEKKKKRIIKWNREKINGLLKCVLEK